MDKITIAYLDYTMKYEHPKSQKHQINWILQPKALMENWIASLHLLPYGFISDLPDSQLLYYNMLIHLAVIDAWEKSETEYFAVMFDDVKFDSFDDALDSCLYTIKNTSKKVVGLPASEWEKTGKFNWLTWRFYFLKHKDFKPVSALHLWQKYHYPHFYITQLAELFNPNDVQLMNLKWRHEHNRT